MPSIKFLSTSEWRTSERH